MVIIAQTRHEEPTDLQDALLVIHVADNESEARSIAIPQDDALSAIRTAHQV
jgi:hypothetical protein